MSSFAPDVDSHERHDAPEVASVASDRGHDHHATRPGRRPQEQTPRRRRRLGPWLFVAAAVAACVWLASTEIDRRLTERDRIGLAVVILDTDTIELRATEASRVQEASVGSQESVSEGDLLAVLQSEDTIAGWTQRRRVELRSPADAIVLSAPPAAGSVLAANATIVELYRPDELYFRAPVSFGLLSQVKIGMSATLEFPSIGEVEARVVRVEPRLDLSAADAPDDRRAYLILEPIDRAATAGLIPGLTLAGWVDATSAPDGAPTGIESGGFGR